MQYWHYLANVLQGDLGPSFKSKDFSVNELMALGFPVSLRLGGIAILLAIVLGTGLGTIAALKQNSGVDYAVMATAMTGIAVPNFVVAPLLTLVFGVYLNWLPVAGWGGGSFRNMLLPIIALALPQIAFTARLTRGSMIEVLRSNYVRNARAKGLPERLTVARHALRAAILPVVSYLAPATAGIITGSVVIETIFDRPLLRAGRAQPRLHVGHGHRDRLRLADHPAQPARRFDLRAAGSEGEVQLMTNAALRSEAIVAAAEIKGRSLWQNAWQRLLRNKAAVVSGIVLGIIAVLAILAPLLSPHAYDEIYWCSAPGSLDTSLSHAAGLIEIAACHA